jgi:phosphoenolpyruvate carboxykinase (GTP)
MSDVTVIKPKNIFTQNRFLLDWVDEMVSLCKPDSIHWCDGSDEENEKISHLLISKGICNKYKIDQCYCCQTDTSKAAATVSTFICTHNKDDAGTANNWQDPREMKSTLSRLFNGSMQGRTMYVIPYSMGPVGSDFSYTGVELTDSPFVVCNMKIMTRMGEPVMEALGNSHAFVKGIHTLGAPLQPGEKDIPWPDNKTKYIAYFPEELSIWSFGSGYFGNSMLANKYVSLKIASYMAKTSGWLAEHMLVAGLSNPHGLKKYFAAAFSDSCGKTNFTMLIPSLPGWKVEVVSDDIAWMKFGADGRLYAINPKTGFYGIKAESACKIDSASFNHSGGLWEKIRNDKNLSKFFNWISAPWNISSKAATDDRESRLAVPDYLSPLIDPAWQDPQGVPISAIIFVGRRSSVLPLVYESFNWEHGVFNGASLSADIEGNNTQINRDPFAMFPYCGYNLGNYLEHWLNIVHKSNAALIPRIFNVNWYRKDGKGNIIWPGFGQNIRIFKWIFERLENDISGIKSPIGIIPAAGELDTEGTNLTGRQISELLRIDKNEWLVELNNIGVFLNTLGTRVPIEIKNQLRRQANRVLNMPVNI